jgi:NAD(P)-dependent dehydrogenase (short-subunit alcohol dehydrogenase family)
MRTVLITGTSTGIGEECTRYLAEREWTVYAGVRRAEDGARLKTTLTGDVRPVLLDVTNRDQMRNVVDDIGRDVGDAGLQGLVNNAGAAVGGPIEYLTEEDWRWTFDVNFFSAVALTQAAMPLLRAGSGRVVHMGSMAGRIASPGVAPYAASKHALEALAEASRQELKRAGAPVRVALIEPGEIKTPIWDKGEATVQGFEANMQGPERERYGWLIEQGRGFVDEGRHKGVPAARVAKAVEHALTARRPRARYLVGPDAKLAGNLIARAPDRVRDALVGMTARRWEQRGKKLSG